MPKVPRFTSCNLRVGLGKAKPAELLPIRVWAILGYPEERSDSVQHWQMLRVQHQRCVCVCLIEKWHAI